VIIRFIVHDRQQEVTPRRFTDAIELCEVADVYQVVTSGLATIRPKPAECAVLLRHHRSLV
jgi:hypothetical protein